MAAVDSRHMVVLGPVKKEYIIIDAEGDTSLANVETFLANPFAVDVREFSHTDGTTNDTQTKATSPLAAFSAAATPTAKLIDVTVLTATKWYIVEVFGF